MKKTDSSYFPGKREISCRENTGHRQKLRLKHLWFLQIKKWFDLINLTNFQKQLITFTPLAIGLYSAMTFNTIWRSLMMLSLPHPLKLQINKHLFKDLCFLEQFNLVYVTDACIKAFKPYPW